MSSSDPGRDNFLQELIAELQRQKDLSGGVKNVDNLFYTGDKPSGIQVFRKLCYDFPSVDEELLRVLYDSIKLFRERKGSTSGDNGSSDEFRKIFCLNDVFLSNIIDMTQRQGLKIQEENNGESDNEDDKVASMAYGGSLSSGTGYMEGTTATAKSNPFNLTAPLPKSPSSEENVSKLPNTTLADEVILELFLLLPVKMLGMDQTELSRLLSNDVHSILSGEYVNSSSTKDTLPWIEILQRCKNFLMKGTSSLISTSFSAEVLVSRGCFTSLQVFIQLVNSILIKISGQETLPSMPVTTAKAAAGKWKLN